MGASTIKRKGESNSVCTHIIDEMQRKKRVKPKENGDL